jgi:hypothetical protein
MTILWEFDEKHLKEVIAYRFLLRGFSVGEGPS